MGKRTMPFINPAVTTTFATRLNELQARKTRMAAYEEGVTVSKILQIALENFIFSNTEKRKSAIRMYYRKQDALENLRNAARLNKELEALREEMNNLPSGVWDADLRIQKKAVYGPKPTAG